MTEVKRTILGSIQSRKTCDTCHGSGKVPKEKCTTCKGAGITTGSEKLKIKIPAGIENGQTLQVSGLGEAIQGGEAGDLLIRIHVTEHSMFRKSGADIRGTLKINVTKALLGTDVLLDTVDGPLTQVVPENTGHGEILRVKGKGVVSERSGKRGDLLIEIDYEYPKKISKTAKKLLEELDSEIF